jgi:polar amino acid transport system substrate-binding protein
MKLFRRLMTLLGIIPALFISMAATADYSPVMEKFLKTGELRVGMSGNQPPLNTHSRDGGLIGLEVELAKQLASAMGVEVKFVEKPFGDLLAALDKGDVDIVMSGVSITASRTTRFAFAGPYMMSGKSVLTKSETLAAAHGPNAMNQPQFKFAALDNSTSKDFVEKFLPKSKLVIVKDYDAGVKLVLDDKVDGLIADMTICVLSVLRYPDKGLATLSQPMTVEPIGIAVPANDPQLLNLLDNYLDALEELGYMKELRQVWLKDASWLSALP